MYDRVFHRWLRIPYRLHADVVRDPKKARATLLMIHGIGNNGHAWDDVIKQLPDDIRIITIDLLGFGRSPRPKWIEYNAVQQARSVMRTYLELAVPEQVIIVGHSLGSLIGIEIAKRYPLLVRSMVLCSPPLYRPEDPETKAFLPKPDKVLRGIYRTVQKRPEDFLRVATIAMKYKLVNKVFSVTDENIDTYMASLETAIVNQTSINDAQRIKVPTILINGKLDPVVIGDNLRQLAAQHDNITYKGVMAGHEIKGGMVMAAVKSIKQQLPNR